jgi:hypothetical protein
MCVVGFMLDGGRTVAAQLVPLTDPAPYVKAELPQCALHLYRHLSKTGGALTPVIASIGSLWPHARSSSGRPLFISLRRCSLADVGGRGAHRLPSWLVQAPRYGSSSRSRR